MDEPAGGLTPRNRSLIEVVENVSARVTIVLIEHVMHF